MLNLELYKKDIEDNIIDSIATYCKQRHIDVDDVYTTLSIEADDTYPQVEGLYVVKLDFVVFAIKDEEAKFRLEEHYRYSKFHNNESSAFAVHLTRIGNMLLKDVFDYIHYNFIAKNPIVNEQSTWNNQDVAERLKQYKKLSIYKKK